jgi:hypothetical protein
MRRRFSLLGLGAALGVALLAGCFNVPALPAGSTAGGSSGGTAKGDAATPFCPSFVASDWSVFFCSDFDPPEAALPGPWGTEEQTSGTLAENGATFASSPSSLDENVIGVTGTDPVDVALRAPLTFSSLPASMKLELSIDPVTIDPEVGAAIVLTALDFFDENQRQYSLQLAGDVVNKALTLTLGEVSVFGDADGGGPPFIGHTLPASVSLPLNTWTTIDLEITWQSATEAQAIVDVSGAEQLNIPLTVTVNPVSMQVDVGTSFIAPSRPAGEFTAPWEVRYDSVVFTAK